MIKAGLAWVMKRAKVTRCRRHWAGALIFALCGLGSLHAAKTVKYSAAVDLGAWKENINDQCVLFVASMNSADFSNLEQTDGKQGPQFTKVGKPVRFFPDHVSVQVSASSAACDVSAPASELLPEVKDVLANLRFEVKWDMASGIRGRQNPAAKTEEAAASANDPVRYTFDVQTKGAPIASRSIVSILAPDGRKITDFQLGF